MRRFDLRWFGISTSLACTMLSCASAFAEDSAFVAAVVRTSPIAYFRLEANEGKSQTSDRTFSSSGGVSVQPRGVDPDSKSNSYARLDGHDGFIATTQRGGIGRAGSIMAWVNLARTPSQAGRILYVAGESQGGNDFDLQFEPDDSLRFYTASGSHVQFSPPVANLAGQWHMIVATFDTERRTRALYWDGVAVANDGDPGKAGKVSQFTIGASPVFTGRFFDGGIDEVALWNKSLGAAEVARLYAAANPNKTVETQAPWPAPQSGSITTTAKVEIEDAKGKIALKPEERIAMMFLSAFQSIELDCTLRANAACTMDQMKGKLKYDPVMDPNYSYTVKVNGKAWEARADPKKPGIGGFYFIAKIMSPDAYFNEKGPAGPMDRELTSRGIEGDSFAVH